MTKKFNIRSNINISFATVAEVSEISFMVFDTKCPFDLIFLSKGEDTKTSEKKREPKKERITLNGVQSDKILRSD